MKVYNRENINKKVQELSGFQRLIRILSKYYLLPLRYNEDYTEVKFTLLHMQTAVHGILISIPFLLSCIWWASQPSYMLDLWNVASAMYTSFDLYTMMSMISCIVNPLTVFPANLLFCHM